MKYKIQIADLSTQYIRIQAFIQSPNETTQLTFPAWRPGRYELGDFAKNVRNFKVYNTENKPVKFQKTAKNTWEVDSSETSELHIDYLYYASELNAGSTFVSDEQLYVNPVNCFVYDETLQNEACEVVLDIDSKWEVACALHQENNVLSAPSYHELVDAPFIASPSLQHETYSVEGTLFHIWFQGECKPDWKKLKRDFMAFTKKQFDHFGSFPFESYHFFFQITPYKTYHGVEHRDSTVIALGPSYDIMDALYTELLGVSSHELYHAWNVKTIRPIEMAPYNYSKENYSKLGFVCEGVTTYLGDQFLLKSKVFDIDQYLVEIGRYVQRHFDNFGRFSMSVADASYDTWLDGYIPGAPNRKTNIYVEGCMIAFICDVEIMRATKNTQSLNDVMRAMYEKYGKNDKGYSVADYKSELENVSGISFDAIFNELVFGTVNYEGRLKEAFEYLGIDFSYQASAKISHAKLGVKTLVEKGQTVIKQLYPGGDLNAGGFMLDDVIISINGMRVTDDFEKWVTYFKDDTNMEMIIERKGRMLELMVPLTSKNYFLTYVLSKNNEPSKAQREAYNFWCK